MCLDLTLVAPADVHERLQAVTRQAILHFRTRLDSSEAHVRARVSSAAITLSISQLLIAAASRTLETSCHALCSLPQGVLHAMCRHLSLADAMRLSATSRDMRAALLGIPGLWTEVYTDSSFQQPAPARLDTQVLASYLNRSGQQALSLNLCIAYDLIVTEDQAPVLARSMRRVSRLCVEFYCDTPHRTRSGWQCFHQQVLCEPAPLLCVLDMSAFNGPVDDPGDPDWSTHGKLALGPDLFGGAAPRLQTCRLVDVRLPPREHCGVFGNVTALCYSICGDISSDDLTLIAEVMPRLETFQLGSLVLPGESHDGGSSSGPAFKSLRSLQLGRAASRVRMNTVLPSLISFQQLSELWLVESQLDTQIDLLLDFAALYPAMDSLSLSLRHHRLLGHLTCSQASSPTRVVGNTLPYHSLLATWLGRYPPLTHLEIHEIYLNNEVLGPPPPLPRVTTLAVRLARCIDWYFHGWECSGIVADAPWVLPALREVRVAPALNTTTGHESDSKCGYYQDACICSRPLRIAMREVVCWVRSGLVFDAERLDRISFAGVQVVDGDFCAAWEEVLEIAHHAELSEVSDEMVNFRNSNYSHGQWQDTLWT